MPRNDPRLGSRFGSWLGCLAVLVALTAFAPAPGKVQISGWALDPNAPLKPVSIRAYLGGKAGEGASGYELGPVAVQERTDLLAEHLRRARELTEHGRW